MATFVYTGVQAGKKLMVKFQHQIQKHAALELRKKNNCYINKKR